MNPDKMLPITCAPSPILPDILKEFHILFKIICINIICDVPSHDACSAVIFIVSLGFISEFRPASAAIKMSGNVRHSPTFKGNRFLTNTAVVY